MLQHFEVYQKARVSFVQAVADAATRPTNIEVMQNAGVMQLLKPLLLDNVGAPPLPASLRTSGSLVCMCNCSPCQRTNAISPTYPPTSSSSARPRFKV